LVAASLAKTVSDVLYRFDASANTHHWTCATLTGATLDSALQGIGTGAASMTAAAWRRILGLLGEGVSLRLEETTRRRLDSRLADMMDDGGRYRGQGRRPNLWLSHMKQLPNGRLQRIEWYENGQVGEGDFASAAHSASRRVLPFCSPACSPDFSRLDSALVSGRLSRFG
jgi:hypothetical protein